MAKNKFKRNIKRWRVKLKMTQAQLATELRIPRPTIGAYEEGRSTPKLDGLIKMAEYFGITVDELIK